MACGSRNIFRGMEDNLNDKILTWTWHQENKNKYYTKIEELKYTIYIITKQANMLCNIKGKITQDKITI